VIVADHVAYLAAEGLLARLGVRRNLELDAPGDLVLVEFEHFIVEYRLCLANGRLRCGPVADDFQAIGVEEVERRIPWAIVELFFRVVIDVPAGFELRRDPIGHSRTGLYLSRLN
jgi:hypothetical protein